MKHLDLRFFWLQDQVQEGVMAIKYIPTAEMVADMLTKALPRVKVDELQRKVGLI